MEQCEERIMHTRETAANPLMGLNATVSGEHIISKATCLMKKYKASADDFEVAVVPRCYVTTATTHGDPTCLYGTTSFCFLNWTA